MAEGYDLVLVGTGFASSFFLHRYLQKAAPNKRILVLERGSFHSLKDRLLRKNGEKQLKITGFEETYQNTSDKPWVFDPNFGGSSNCWTGCTPRFLPSDFRMNSLYGKATDWPISYDELEPYYMQAEQIMSIAGPEVTPFPRSGKYPLPPQTLSTVDNILQQHHGQLYISQPTARATRALASRNACCSSAVCNLCPMNAKFTIENALIDIYSDPRVTLLYESQVIGLETAGSAAKSITWLNRSKEYKARAETFIIGANAIFNAHILLNSDDSNPLTGAGITEQVGIFTYFHYDGLDNLGGSSIITANGYMMYDGAHRKDRAACIIESFNTPIVRNERGKWRQLSLFKFIYEDLPNNKNRVARSDDPTRPVVHYSGHSDYVNKSMERLREDIDTYFGMLPIEKVMIDEAPQPTEYHICSTVRMGNTSGDSCVDKDMRHHQFRNVLVLGSSSFPTVTPANPTLTLSALSLRAADSYFS